MTVQPFILLVDIPLKPGRADELMALLNDVFEAMKVEETFVGATVLHSTGDLDKILLYEDWIDLENLMSVQMGSALAFGARSNRKSLRTKGVFLCGSCNS
jgi:hypothetical protein